MSKRLPTGFETGVPDQPGASSEDDEHRDSSFERPGHGVGPRILGLTTQAEPRRTSDVNRESGTESANRRWLQRIVRLFRGN